MDKIIDVVGLKKSYGDVQAVKDISFYVEEGKLFAFLGPNGAGKSTTIDILCTLLRPDAGEVTIDSKELNKNDAQIRQNIGVVFQDGILDPLLTVKENLLIRGSFYSLSDTRLKKSVERAAQYAGVTDFFNRPYGKLSGGQRRRADIARALVNTPKILFLDEPTTGLDPQTRKNIWDTIKQLQRENNMTVFLTTHYMEEAADADYVIVIDDGLIAAQGTPAQLRERYTSDSLKLNPGSVSALEAVLKENSISYQVVGDSVTVSLPSTLDAISIINKCEGLLESFEVLMGSMDDVFIAITGKEMR